MSRDPTRSFNIFHSEKREHNLMHVAKSESRVIWECSGNLEVKPGKGAVWTREQNPWDIRP